ncbi:MAG TPA: methylthioribulose 1-phosphate dehydratase [Pyrinomonadaceae bacterium]
MSESLEKVASELARVASVLHARGWMLGTSGNLSAVVETEPLRLAITPSGLDKGELSSEQILLIDENGKSIGDHRGKPSDETPLHISVITTRGAGAVAHTHSVWATILSDLHAAEGGLAIEGYEMLKGLRGVTTHLHKEWIPIFDNSQEMPALAESISEVLARQPNTHAFLLRRHGLYTWGRDLKETQRHVEILEFLLEAVGRTWEIG